MHMSSLTLCVSPKMASWVRIFSPNLRQINSGDYVRLCTWGLIHAACTHKAQHLILWGIIQKYLLLNKLWNRIQKYLLLNKLWDRIQKYLLLNKLWDRFSLLKSQIKNLIYELPIALEHSLCYSNRAAVFPVLHPHTEVNLILVENFIDKNLQYCFKPTS